MNIEFEKQMGRNIRHIREEKGMTQELLLHRFHQD